MRGTPSGAQVTMGVLTGAGVVSGAGEEALEAAGLWLKKAVLVLAGWLRSWDTPPVMMGSAGDY
jgi:hypothetical protein